ncbi:DUF6783 domain-containing protein [uncultured Robinsoniella sp.]
MRSLAGCRDKSLTNCGAQLPESNFKTLSSLSRGQDNRFLKSS